MLRSSPNNHMNSKDINSVQSNKVGDEKGFTLVEIMVAMVILVIVAALAVPIYRDYTISAETVDVISALEALELEVRAPAVPREDPVTCDNNLVKPENLVSRYLDLSIGKTPNNPTDYTKGFAATLHVNAATGKVGAEGVEVARAFYQEISEKRPSQLVSGATISDSIVSFSILLSIPGEPFCDPGVLTTSPNRPPIVRDLNLGHMTSGSSVFKIPGPALLHGVSDPDGDALHMVGEVTSPDGAIFLGNGYVTFQPAIGFTGTATIEFKITDGSHTVTGRAMIDVTQPRAVVNHPPRVGDVAYGRVTPAGINLKSQDLLGRSGDYEGDSLSVLSVSSNTAEGTIDSQNAPYSYFFLPAPGFVGKTVLNFQVSDGHNTVIGKATITVIAP
jgi:prepilin-type N-terminal cleavage/methylation domain-containing protein